MKNNKSKIKLKCEYCKKIYYKDADKYKRNHPKDSADICSNKCKGYYAINKFGFKPKRIITCSECGKNIYKLCSQIKRSKVHFCSQSCSGSYNRRIKKSGFKRSKLERYIEKNIKKIYPLLKYECNVSNIGLELDFYFPHFKIGIEINGILHYKAIYGKEKLINIKYRDRKKIKLCKKKGIKLFIIVDMKSTPKSIKQKWNEVKKIIDDKMNK